ncbi:MAG TPA: DUF1003 domain-containing protein [Candidatus Baltobacteraceae bacterium]|nr:DUF1003 domain-containing protein [Candidatus Baltobacteraceae bacterium]
MTVTQPSAALPLTDMENHPLVDDVNAMHQERLSATEKLCRRIADLTGAPLALVLAIVVQLVWITLGALTHWDPFPFVFLLTCSNVLQLILIFVIAVAQKQQTQHDELRAESDHDSISRLLYHDQLQNELLLRIAERTGIDVSELKATAEKLATSPS